MRSLTLFSIPLFLFIACNKTNRLHEKQLNEVDINYRCSSTNAISDATMIVLLDTLMDYYTFEKNNQMSLYHDYIDFQGYLFEVIAPLAKQKKINLIYLYNNKKTFHFLLNDLRCIKVDLNQFKFKQGLILFNGSELPVVWEGPDYIDLEKYIHQYYSLI